MSESFTKLLNPDGYFSEYQMQEDVEKWIKEKRFFRTSSSYPYRSEVEIKVFREFRIPEIGRISDHIVYFSNRKIINIECKLVDMDGVIKQAVDHLRWADYSIICFPLDNLYVPQKYIKTILDKGLGLIYYKQDFGLFQFINPKHNKNVDKELRLKINERISKLTTNNERVSS